MTQDFAYARASRVPNAGEDLANSARHKVNAWRSLAEAEAAGGAVAAQLITRDQLLKNEPLDLSGMTDDNCFAYYVAYCILKTFPPAPFTGDKPYSDFALNNTSFSTNAQLREQFYACYMTLKALLTEKAVAIDNPMQLLAHAGALVSTTIRAVREPGDKYNPFANTLVDFQKRIRMSNGRQKANTVGHKVVAVMLALNAKGLDTKKVEDRPAIRAYLKPLIQGKSFSKVFEVEGKSEAKPTFKEADQYFNFIERVGGKYIYPDTDALAFDMLLETFQLRGIQFGNYVPDKERVKHLRHVLEALADLADVTGLEYADISLYSKEKHMGLAIGARGNNKALAHYEPVEHVTNLTRKSGFGALAHEWWHGFDHMVYGESPKGDSVRYLSQTANRLSRSGLRGQGKMLDAMTNLMQAIDESGYNKRLYSVVEEMVREGTMARTKAGYWTSPEERTARAFERYVQFTLREQNRRNTYLSGNKGHKLWMTDTEVAFVAPAFQQLFKTYCSTR